MEFETGVIKLYDSKIPDIHHIALHDSSVFTLPFSGWIQSNTSYKLWNYFASNRSYLEMTLQGRDESSGKDNYKDNLDDIFDKAHICSASVHLFKQHLCLASIIRRNQLRILIIHRRW